MHWVAGWVWRGEPGPQTPRLAHLAPRLGLDFLFSENRTKENKAQVDVAGVLLPQGLGAVRPQEGQ